VSQEIEVKVQRSKFSLINKFLKHDEKGATAVEYGLLVGLIAVVIIAAVTTLGSVVSDKFNETQCKISGKTWTAATKTCA
jgi:pilus assembly protein Flp/PilA